MIRPTSMQSAASATAIPMHRLRRQPRCGRWPNTGPGITALFLLRRGPRLVAGIGDAELDVKSQNPSLEQAYLLAQCSDLSRALATARGLGAAQFRAKLLDLPGQILNGRGAADKSVRCGADEDAFPGVAGHQPVRAELGDRSPDHRDGDPVHLAELRRGRDRRADRELRRGDPLAEVASDLLVRRTSDGIGHLAILPHPRRPRRPLPLRAPGEGPPASLMHKVEHSLLDCYGPLRTRTDPHNQRPSPARHPRSAESRSDASMQKANSARGPPLALSHAFTPQHATSPTRPQQPRRIAAKHTRRGRTPYQEASPSCLLPCPSRAPRPVRPAPGGRLLA